MSKEAMKLALEALTATMSTHGFREHIEETQDKAIKALEEALAKQEQGEPVAWADHGVVNWIADKQFKHAALLYEHPQQRTWVGLTDKEMHECAGEYPWTPIGLKCVRAIEAKLKEKNT